MEDTSGPLRCPFCGRSEAERLMVDGKMLIVFPCMFSPLVETNVAALNLQEHLNEKYGNDPGYFRKQCDKLHLAVVKGVS